MTPITFQAIEAATHGAGEPGHLVWVCGRLVALLVRAEDGWFLQHGFGPFDQEGVLFDTVQAAEDWVRRHLPDGWLDAVLPSSSAAI